MGLDIKNDAYKKNIPVSFADLQKHLPALKDIDWVADCPAESLVASIQKLEKSFKNFFDKRCGFPKYQSKRRNNSIQFKSTKQHFTNTFKLPKLGNVRVFKDRPIRGELRPISTVIKERDKYFLCVCCKVDAATKSSHDSQVGIDVGIANFATLSDGSIISHPHILRTKLIQLRKLNRKLSRAKRFGSNWKKIAKRLSSLHRKVYNTRRDFLHKATTSIASKYDFISVENLNVHGLQQSRLAKDISDSGWYCFTEMLHYKCDLYGKTLVKVQPHYSSQECFNCGHVAKENRISQSQFTCINCGHKDNADINASKNLLRRGHRLLAQSTDNSLRLAKEQELLS